ncbi:MAG: hypothetical protein ABJK28_09310 [Algibacter sp.]
MKITEEIKKRYSEEAIETINWLDDLLHKAQEECKESYIGNDKVHIYINDKIGFLTFKKYNYTDYDNALLHIAKRERDKILNGKRKSFDISTYINTVKQQMSILSLDNCRNNGYLKGRSKEKQRRKRIPIKISEHIKL